MSCKFGNDINKYPLESIKSCKCPISICPCFQRMLRAREWASLLKFLLYRLMHYESISCLCVITGSCLNYIICIGRKHKSSRRSQDRGLSPPSRYSTKKHNSRSKAYSSHSYRRDSVSPSPSPSRSGSSYSNNRNNPHIEYASSLAAELSKHKRARENRRSRNDRPMPSDVKVNRSESPIVIPASPPEQMPKSRHSITPPPKKPERALGQIEENIVIKVENIKRGSEHIEERRVVEERRSDRLEMRLDERSVRMPNPEENRRAYHPGSLTRLPMPQLSPEDSESERERSRSRSPFRFVHANPREDQG